MQYGVLEIRGRRSLSQSPVLSTSDDLRNEHRHRLTEHGGFCFDAADAPTYDAQTVDHGGVGVGTHQGIWISLWRSVRPSDRPTVRRKHHASQVLELHLVHDARIRRHDLEP